MVFNQYIESVTLYHKPVGGGAIESFFSGDEAENDKAPLENSRRGSRLCLKGH